MKNQELKIKGGYHLPKISDEKGALEQCFRAAFCASSGSGKTNAACNWIRQYYNDPEKVTRRILISPTGCINEMGIRTDPSWGVVNIDEEHHDFTPAILAQILEDQKVRLMSHKKYLEDKKLYQKFVREGPDSISYHDLLHLYDEYGLEEPKPEYSLTDSYPSLLLILDDCCDSTRSKSMEQLIAKSRHYCINLCFLVQNYSMMSPKVRNNLNALMMYKTSNHAILKSIYEQNAAGDMTLDEFLNMFEKNLHNKWDFIMMNFQAPKKEDRYFKNFGEKLVV